MFVKVMSVLGIRPDWIKMRTVLSELDRRDLKHVMVHTGQHYSYNLDRVFFEQLQIRKADYHLGVGSGTQGQQTAKIVERSEKVMLGEKPDVVVVFGDSNSSLAALAAAKMNVRVAHIEAGMRAYDWRMPEEKNKRIVDHLSSLLFVYTKWQRDNLLKEQVHPSKVHVVGNPTVDVIKQFYDKAKKDDIGRKLDLERRDYFLVTAHRAENVDDKKRLKSVLKSLELVHRRYRKRVIWSLYPRTKKRIEHFHLKIPRGVEDYEPMGFLEFLNLEMNALCAITDSGTVQEETCILKIPCVVIRLSTERPETVELGSSIVAGLEPSNVLRCVRSMLRRKTDWNHPYGNGKTGRKVADIIERNGRWSPLKETLEEAARDKRHRICFTPFVR
jgi:UDP-N-acetylglucosamine 2-epimerase (non-hydrolysing)